MRESRDRFSAGLALGLAVALAVSLASGSRAPLPNAFGQSGSTASSEYLGLVANAAAPGEQHVIFLDAKSNRLMVYDVKANELSLVAVRDITYDQKFAEWGRTFPKVGEMRDATKPPANP